MRFTVFGEIKDPEKAVQAAAAGAENARDAGRKTDSCRLMSQRLKI